MWTIPRRVTGSAFGAALTCTAELPCPDGGARFVIQVASVLAVHAHSGCAAIATVAITLIVLIFGEPVDRYLSNRAKNP